MNLWSRLLGARHPPAIDERRWIVLDVETTGLDVRRDTLLAIAAVAVHFEDHAAPRIVLQDSFEALLRHEGERTDKGNILLHGIGVGEQRRGAPAREVLGSFEQWLGHSPLLAFHAAFDRAMLGRAMKAELQRGLPHPWLDLAPVAAALHPGVSARALDEWLEHFGIDCAVRHQAAADTLATAELLLRLWPAARAKRCASFAGLSALARQERWLRSS